MTKKKSDGAAGAEGLDETFKKATEFMNEAFSGAAGASGVPFHGLRLSTSKLNCPPSGEPSGCIKMPVRLRTVR